MRYEKGHKDATKERIIDVASRRFKGEGVAAVGLAGLMQDAGLTNGAFYAHFKSKQDLVEHVLADALDRRNIAVAKILNVGGNIEAVIRGYLSPRHCANAEQGCVTAALISEVSRHPKSTRAIHTQKIESFIKLIAPHMLGKSASDRRLAAYSLFGILIGSLQLARVGTDPALSKQILEGGISAALLLTQKTPSRTKNDS